MSVKSARSASAISAGGAIRAADAGTAGASNEAAAAERRGMGTSRANFGQFARFGKPGRGHPRLASVLQIEKLSKCNESEALPRSGLGTLAENSSPPGP